MPKYFLLCIFAFTVISVQGQDLDPREINRAMTQGIGYLKRTQDPVNGNWATEGSSEWCGATALAVLAMRSCGVPPNDPSIQNAMRFMRARSGELAGRNYSLALQTMAFCAVDPERDRMLIRENIALLEKRQARGEPHGGGWDYITPGGTTDLSNSQFVILALYEAERVGVRVSDATWNAALRYWSATQNGNGSWGYTPQAGGGSGGSTGSMTTAGIASLIISAGVLERGGATVEGDNIICFQRPDNRYSQQVARGVDWLADPRVFSVSTNPGSSNYLLYYLYALERVGRMTNQRFIGRHDWYRAGTEKILALQNKDSGHWHMGTFVIADTSFALLFLSKGRRPVLMSKIQFGNDDAWNVHPNDVNNLTLFVESKWRFEMTWQTIDIRHATVDHLLQSPVISFSAKNWQISQPEMEALAKKLREYIDQGGFIIAEPQPGGASFDRTFRALMERVFPEPGYELTLLERSHAIWSAEQAIDPEHIRPLEGIQYGCRTSVVYIPEVEGKHSLSCLWEVHRHFLRGGADAQYPDVVQRKIDNGLGIGLNILAYATSRELRNKDAIPEHIVKTQTDSQRRGRIFLPFLEYGATNPAPNAPRNLLAYLDVHCGMRVDLQPRSVTLSEETLGDYPLLFMHGRGTLELTEAQHRRLRQHLERGGFLFANSICSADDFSTSFRAELRKVFPNAQWQRIPLSDPIFSDNYGGFPIDTLDIRLPERTPGQQRTVAQTRPTQPELWGIRLSDDDRWLVVFSPYDVSCALEKTNSLECRGYSRQSALQLSANVILYALEHW
ncbi:MAG: DUF4159 domain-containing protein [Planctomycetaceae bacterium]|nr:DUF4159 domain-containing protein [Planctomycetaceae bacterium]